MRTKTRLAAVRSLRTVPILLDGHTGTDTAALPPTTLASVAYERLRNDVRHGQFKPGSKLHIEMLMERYAMGRSPIREALNRLSSEALVVQEDQRGFSMPSVSIEDLEELTRTRCWIYEIGLRESIKRGAQEWEESVVLAYYRLSRIEKCGPNYEKSAAAEQIHRAFHAALISACGSRWICDLAEKLFDLAEQYRTLSAGMQGSGRDAASEHKVILDAVLDRNTPLATELLNRHMTLTAELAKQAVGKFAAKT